MYRMKDLRNLDLNLYYFIASGLVLNGYTILSGYSYPYVNSGIYLTDAFPEDMNDMKVPAIAIEHRYSRDDPFQLGQGKTSVRKFSISVYARTDGERDDLGEMVKNFLDNPVTIYDYNLVITGNVYQSVGIGDFDRVVMTPVRDNEFKVTKHGMEISFDCSYSINSGSSLIN